MRIRHTDGEYRWFLCRAVPLRDNRGKAVKWYGAATDIQERKRAEELQPSLAYTNRVSSIHGSRWLAELDFPQMAAPVAEASSRS